MRTLSALMIALTAILAVTPAQAGTVETEYDYTLRCESYSLYLSQPVSGKTGVFAYAADTNVGWSEAYAGLTYAPTSNLCLSFGAGGQSGTDETRYGGSVWAGKEKVSLLWLWEQGGGEWNKLVLKYQLTPNFAAGYVEKTSAGNGLYLEYSPTADWTVKAYDYDSGRMFSVIKSFTF